MGLQEIRNLNELIGFLPLLARLHQQFDTISNTQGTLADFIASLTNNFGKDAYYYGLKKDDELYYFFVVHVLNKTEACLWLVYINKTKHSYTKNLLSVLMSEFRRKGIKHAEFTTTIMKKSYERWVSKFGAKKHSITFKLEL